MCALDPSRPRHLKSRYEHRIQGTCSPCHMSCRCRAQHSDVQEGPTCTVEKMANKMPNRSIPRHVIVSAINKLPHNFINKLIYPNDEKCGVFICLTSYVLFLNKINICSCFVYMPRLVVCPLVPTRSTWVAITGMSISTCFDSSAIVHGTEDPGESNLKYVSSATSGHVGFT
jgi:hypothetical protein